MPALFRTGSSSHEDSIDSCSCGGTGSGAIVCSPSPMSSSRPSTCRASAAVVSREGAATTSLNGRGKRRWPLNGVGTCNPSRRRIDAPASTALRRRCSASCVATPPPPPACAAPAPPRWADDAGRGRCVSIFLDKNRRYIGKSQSKRPPKRTQRPPHRAPALLGRDDSPPPRACCAAIGRTRGGQSWLRSPYLPHDSARPGVCAGGPAGTHTMPCDCTPSPSPALQPSLLSRA
eukprot:COSAG01_NODE_431_length_17124_cov_26.577386_7_plen_233_part_00